MMQKAELTLACGPVEKLIGLWQHEKEISNQPRKAWISRSISYVFPHALRDRDSSQSFRVALSSKGTLKVKSSFVAVAISMCLIAQGWVTTDRSSTQSTSGSLSAISLMHE
jgi:hypothetical protein